MVYGLDPAEVANVVVGSLTRVRPDALSDDSSDAEGVEGG